MKPIPAIALCMIVAGVVGVVAFEHRLAREAASRTSSPVAPPASDGASADPQPAAPTALSRPESTPRSEASAEAVRRDLGHAEAARLREEIRTWHLDAQRPPALDPGLTDAARALVAEWRVREAWWQLAGRVEPPLPATVTRVSLANGGTLWASEARSEAGIHHVLLLGSSIRTQVPAERVTRVEPLPRAEYLQATADDYVREVTELERGNASDVTRALGLARLRGDDERYEPLYAKWVAAGGPNALPILLAKSPVTELETAVAWLSQTRPPATPEPPPHTEPAAANEPARPAKLVEVTSLADLQTRLRELKRKVSPRLTATQREAYVAQVNAWEEWLAQRPESAQQTEDARSLLQALQLLRLDLYKTGGF
ncbi:MAG: hypothetical protein AB7O52_09515 [Planctomycetota bacterium]